jgi:hypothetical protein
MTMSYHHQYRQHSILLLVGAKKYAFAIHVCQIQTRILLAMAPSGHMPTDPLILFHPLWPTYTVPHQVQAIILKLVKNDELWVQMTDHGF